MGVQRYNNYKLFFFFFFFFFFFIVPHSINILRILWYPLHVYLAGPSPVGVFEILYVGPRRSCCILALVLRVMSKLSLLDILFLNLPLGFSQWSLAFVWLMLWCYWHACSISSLFVLLLLAVIPSQHIPNIIRPICVFPYVFFLNDICMLMKVILEEV